MVSLRQFDGLVLAWSSHRSMDVSVSIVCDDMLMVDFGNHPQANLRVRALWALLQDSPMMPGVSPVAGMNCLAFMLEPDVTETMDLDALAHEIRGLAESSLKKSPVVGRTLEIPVCYDARFAPDLDRVAKHCGLAAKEVIRLHVSGRYTAQLIGFLPGFAYMGGLAQVLNVPRLDTPRPKVPAGALGITGTQCAIYPTASPGGWNLIGRCPLVLFDTAKESPCLIQLGDTVRFFSISVDEFNRLWSAR